MSQELVAVLLFAVVLALVLWQPGGLSIGWPAVLGGLLAVLLGVVSLADVGEVLRIVWDPTLTFVGLILLSVVLDAAGFFAWAALAVAHRSGGSGRRLFVLSLLLGFGVSALFANDGAALILTPIVYEAVQALELPAPTVLAFVLASGFVADTTSVPLVVSNLVNILSADYFHIGFLAYAARMVPVDLVSLVATAALSFAYFRAVLPQRVDTDRLPAPKSAIRDPAVFRLAFPILGLTFAGYLASPFVHLPVSLVAGTGAALLLAAAWRSPAIDVRRVVLTAPWNIVLFSAGMYVVVFGLNDAGLIARLTALLRLLGRHGLGLDIVATGGLAAVLSAILNNLPSVMVGALAIHATGFPHAAQEALALANVVGCDLGPKMTPIGSLATLLWLHVLARRGERIPLPAYLRFGLLLTPPVLLVSLGALAGVVLALR